MRSEVRVLPDPPLVRLAASRERSRASSPLRVPASCQPHKFPRDLASVPFGAVGPAATRIWGHSSAGVRPGRAQRDAKHALQGSNARRAGVEQLSCRCPPVSQHGAIAQLGEHLLCKQGVVGSIPTGSTSGEGCKTAHTTNFERLDVEVGP